MNLLHIKYAVEVAETGSINRAAEKLMIGQPNLSRAVRELESSLGVRIFQRSARGMSLTPEGETFMSYARSILQQVDALENTFQKGTPAKKRFSISVPRAWYIAEAFSNFSASLENEPDIELFYRETSTYPAVTGVSQEDYKLAIIRYAECYEDHYKMMFDEKNLRSSDITRFRRMLITSRKSLLAAKYTVSTADLSGYTQIAYADPYVPQLQPSEVRKSELVLTTRKRIFIYERASLCTLLSDNPNTFILDAPSSQTWLDRYGLVMKPLADEERIYKDVMICRNDYSYSVLDNMFLSELYKSRYINIENQ